MNGPALIFLAAAAMVLWVMMGHSLVLALRVRLFAKPVRKESFPATVSVILPVRNGEMFLADKLESLHAQTVPVLEILVISDESSDGTDAIAAGHAARGVRLLRQPRGGKCAALNLAIPQARGEILLLTDVRQRLHPQCLEKLLRNFADERVGAVSGELRIHSGASSQEARVGLYWRWESWIRRQLSSLDSMLGATGPIYALRRALAVPVPTACLLDDMYLPLSAFRKGFRLVQEPEAIAWDYPSALEAEFRRKVRTLAGNYQLMTYYPWLLGPGNRMWLDYVSIKVGRLLLPWALLVLLAATPFLPWPWWVAASSAQSAFYLLAASDPLFSEGSPVKKMTSAARAFAVMMLAALLAVRVFFVEPASLWRESSIRKTTNV